MKICLTPFLYSSFAVHELSNYREYGRFLGGDVVPPDWHVLDEIILGEPNPLESESTWGRVKPRGKDDRGMVEGDSRESFDLTVRKG